MRVKRALSLAVELLEIRRLLATITVTSTDDVVTPNNGSVTLREAITAMDAGNDLGDPDITAQNPGTFGTDDTINFNIPGSGVHTITLAPNPTPTFRSLPTITKPMTIDGYSQPGSSVNTNPLSQGDNATLLIAVDGAGTDTPGIEVDSTAAGTVIRGLVIQDMADIGIDVHSAGGTKIEGNFFGTDATGTSAVPNGTGVNVFNSPGAIVGGLTPADANLISGNIHEGVNVSNLIGISLPAPMIVEGNLIGTKASGSEALANAFGIQVQEGPAIVGGTVAAARNVISGNTIGVFLQDPKIGSSVQGNYIGVNAAGDAPLGNLNEGIEIEFATGNLIGGTVAGAGNVICGNGFGIVVDDSGLNLIQGNLIGVLPDGTTAAGNTNDGVDIADNSNFNIVGGPTMAAGNVIANNAGIGVDIVKAIGNSTQNSIERNSIYNNGGLGIDLEDISAGPNAGITPNDPGDGDFGPNNSQNFPVIGTASSTSSAVTVAGTFNSLANTTFVLDFYASDTVDASGNGEGSQYIGSIPLITDANGNASFNQTFNVAIGANKYISATATNSSTAPYGDTSEFSQSVEAAATITTPPPPPATLSIDNLTHAEGNSGTSDFIFTITRSGDLSGALSVAVGTADGTASVADGDYLANAAIVNFAAGDATASFTVKVNGDTKVEPDETFLVNLSGATGAVIATAQGIGTITNDDVPPPPPSNGKVSLVTDPCDASKKALKIEGTDNKDTITVTKSGSSQGKVVVKINGSNKGTFTFSGILLVYGKNGSDNINIDLSISRTAMIFAGEGNDTVSAGSGADAIAADGGNDNIKGNAGRDILFGGDGADKLDGGSGDDILVAGGTSQDDDPSTICKLLDEWKRTDKNYSQRVSHILNGGGLNGSVKLNASNIFSSAGAKDSLTGGSSTDLFFAAVPGDLITDKVSGETVVDVG